MSSINITLGPESINLINYYLKALYINSGIIEVQTPEENNILNTVGDIIQNTLSSMVDDAFDAAEQAGANAIYNSVDKLYDSLGINKDSLELAGLVVDLINASITKFSCLLKLVPTNIAMIPSAKQTLTNIISSYKTILTAAYIDIKAKYFQIKDALINNMPSTLEILILAENTLIDMIMEYIELQCYNYIGYTIVELYDICIEGINKYKHYKNALRDLKEKSSDIYDTINTQNDEINAIGVKANINVNINIEELKLEFMLWLAAQNDAIYNGFILLLIREIAYEIKFVIQLMSNVNLKVLAQSINSLDDFISLLRELGCDNEMNIITLDEAKSFLINRVSAALNSLENSMLNTLDIDVTMNPEKTFDIRTDSETKTIYITYFQNPLLYYISRKVYNVFKKAEDQNGKKIFNESQLITLRENINDLYNKKENGVFELGEFKINIRFSLEDKKNKNSTNTTTHINLESYELGFVIEEYSYEPTQNAVRKTIQVIHILFDLLILIMPYIKTFATLVSNYKINKEMAKHNASINLFSLLRLNCHHRGLNKNIDTAKYNFYTVRTLELYNFIYNNFIKDTLLNTTTIYINEEQTNILINWLYDNNLTNSLIPNVATTLYIDMDSINELKNNLDNLTLKAMDFFGDDASLFVKYPKAKYKNGSLIGLNKIEKVGEEIYYNDSSLPLMNSQIWIAFSLKLDPSI